MARSLCVPGEPHSHGQQIRRYSGCRRTPDARRASSHEKASFWSLALGSVGVVYGDIGTSPLYAFREAVVAAQAGGPVTRDIVLGVLSLIVWSLIVVVTLKYVVLLLRMDNNGEGGTMSLTALAFRALGRRAPCCADNRHHRGGDVLRVVADYPGACPCCRRSRD